jgi:hypothetical protein
MAGLVPAIHAEPPNEGRRNWQRRLQTTAFGILGDEEPCHGVDARHKAGNDGDSAIATGSRPSFLDAFP